MLGWLDAGLRRGEGRLAAEYPLAFGEEARVVQRVVFAGDAPVAHALLQAVEVQGRGRVLRIGLIGSVYSDPCSRGRGHAQACLRALLAEARAERLALVLLWSELTDFYARLGFVPAGRDALIELDAARLARLRGAGPAGVAPARAEDFAALEALHARKPVRVRRPAGALARLAAAPDTQLVVAHAGGRPVAYAALGRGDDFRGVVHEWAGDGAGVLACLAHLSGEHGPLRLLASPEPEAPVPTLLAAGAALEPRALGLVHLLDAGELWRALVAPRLGVGMAQRGDRVELWTREGTLLLPAAAALELCFGAGPGALGEALAPRLRTRLGSALPWPLYVWGFDSV